MAKCQVHILMYIHYTVSIFATHYKLAKEKIVNVYEIFH